MNHNDILLERAKIDGITKFIQDQSARSGVKLKILDALNIRLFNKITQKEMAIKCSVSLRTIQRFEKLEIDSITLFLNYRAHLKNLPYRAKQKTKL